MKYTVAYLVLGVRSLDWTEEKLIELNTDFCNLAHHKMALLSPTIRRSNSGNDDQ